MDGKVVEDDDVAKRKHRGEQRHRATMALLLAERGAAVLLDARRIDALARVADAIAAVGGHHSASTRRSRPAAGSVAPSKYTDPASAQGWLRNPDQFRQPCSQWRRGPS